MNVMSAALGIASSGAASDGASTFSESPRHCTTPNPPVAATDEPSTPPINAWLELDGRPMYQVMRFQAMAPTSPASTTLSVIAEGSTTPLATVAATLIETNAPAKLSAAEPRTARRGGIARVETLVAMAFAVS